MWEPIPKRTHTQLVRKHSAAVVSPSLWTDPGPKSEISLRDQISIKKKKKKAQAGNEVKVSPKILAHEEKATTLLFANYYGCYFKKMQKGWC